MFRYCLPLLLLLACSPPKPTQADSAYPTETPAQPNILWIVAEDLSPVIPSFGDSTVQTPNISRLVAEGVRYTNVYSPSGVCAPSRAALATGMYPSSISANHMRTGPWYIELPPPILKEHIARSAKFMPEGLYPYEAVPPVEVKMHGEVMRRLGYYCTNNAKEDYQFRKTLTAWDDCSRTAHWRNRPEGKPFFSIFNIEVTHESRIWVKAQDSLWIDADLAVPIPPYLPDTEIAKRDVRRMYSNIKEMDHRVGEILAELEEDGLLENTVIFWYSDHGGPLPRQKRLMHDSGLRVPMAIRFPNQAFAGTTDDRLISFIDFMPTIMSLAGEPTPDYMQGQAFLGPHNAPARDYIHGAGDRFDELYDGVRAVRDQRFKYIRHLDTTQMYYLPLNYRENMPIMQELLRMREEEKLNPIQAQWFRLSRPAEELFDCEADPHEINNLAEDPAYGEKLAELRAECDRWLVEIDDVGLMPETELIARLQPEGEAFRTAATQITAEADKISLSSQTEGASIAYQYVHPDSNLSPSWQVYMEPIRAQEGMEIATVSHRIGYLRSDTIRFK
ncbi:MAG: sulfatase [Bacteroidota bacterium]